MSQGDYPSKALQREAEAWVVTLTSGEATRADADALDRWRSQSTVHEDSFRRAARLWRDLGDMPSTGRPSKVRPSGLDRRALLGGGLALAGAGVVMLRHPPLNLWPSLDELGADYRTPPGGSETVAIADGLSARLNTRTALSRTGDGVRLLTGEAMFETRPAAAPQILAGAARIDPSSVLLNVRLLDADGEITCLAGVATVACGDHRVALAANQRVAFSGGRLETVRAADPRRTSAWTNGLLIFNADPLSTVIDEINRYRPVPALLRNRALAGRPISGAFNLDALDQAIVHLAQVNGARLTRLPGGFLVLG